MFIKVSCRRVKSRSKIMKVNWRLILGSPKVDTEAKKELGASSYLEGDSRKYKGVSRENQMGKKAKPIKGCVNEQLLLGQTLDPSIEI